MGIHSAQSRFVDGAVHAIFLSAEEEHTLFVRWKKYREQWVSDRIITAFRPFVSRRLMTRYHVSTTHENFEQYHQAGCVGLRKALDKFEPTRGFKFATYAQWWVDAEIQEEFSELSLINYTTTSARKRLFFKFNKFRKQAGVTDPATMTHAQAEHIARIAKVETKDVLEYVCMRYRVVHLDHDASQSSQQEDGTIQQADIIPDENALNPEEECERVIDEETYHRHIQNAVSTLKPRYQRIFTARRLTDPQLTLEELGNEFGISRERVRQLEMLALRKVTKFVREALSNPFAPVPATAQDST